MVTRRQELAEVRRWTHWLAGESRGLSSPHPEGRAPMELLANARLSEYIAAALDPTRADARENEQRTLAENVLMLDVLRHVGRALTAAGLVWCAIKGAAMLVYRPRLTRVRRMSDIDVVVAPDALDAALKTLVAMGGIEVVGVATRSTRSVHFAGPGAACAIDLHGGLGLGEHFVALGTQLLRSSREVAGVSVPSPEALALATVLHRAKGVWSGDLREVFDLYSLFNGQGVAAAQTPDPPQLCVLAEQCGLQPHLLLSVIEVEQWFGTTAASSALRIALQRRVAGCEARAVRIYADELSRHGGLRWARVPVVARYVTLAALERSPAGMLLSGARYAASRARRVLRDGRASGGRAGRWFNSGG
jgi:hypothetical protein